MARAYVVAQDAVEGVRAEGDTARVTTTFGPEQGCTQLEQRVLRFAPGRSRPRQASGRDELLYVASGLGTLELDGTPHPLAPDTAAYVVAGESRVIENPGPADLVVVAVLANRCAQTPAEGRRVTIALGERPLERADAKRTFRVLVSDDTGCRDATQFVGFVEPYRAPDHSHPYDEVGYVLEGTGFAHIDGEQLPLGPGSCFHLPPGKVHCIENVGPGVMRILGVFHPTDSPASRAYDAAQAAAVSRSAAAAPHSRAIHRGRAT